MKTISKLICALILLVGPIGRSAAQMSLNFTKADACKHDGSATANPSGGTTPYTYQWKITEKGQSSQTFSTQSVSGLWGEGSYRVTVTDFTGKTISDSVILKPPFSIYGQIKNSSCGKPDGAIYLGASNGASPFSYSWSNGFNGGYLTGVTPGIYEVTVSDANGCSRLGSEAVKLEVLSQGLMAYDSLDNAICPQNNGRISVSVYTGTSPYTFLWSNGATGYTASNLAPGKYSVTITDASGCSAVLKDSVGSVGAFNTTFNITPSGCMNNEGTASANVSGGIAPYSFVWATNPPQTSSTAINIPSGYYGVKITDSQGCSKEEYFGVSRNNPFSLYCTYTPAYCNNKGTATAVVSGSSGPYSYFWKDSTGIQSTQTATNLAAGKYGLTVTDANGCTMSAEVNIPYTSGFNVSHTITKEHCNDKNGSIAINVSGGTAPYNVAWNTNPAQSGMNATNLTYGWYEAVITDNGGCSAKKGFFVDRNSPVKISFTSIPPSCNQPDGQITVNASNGTAPYSYLWGNSSGNQTLSNVSGGWFGVKVTDAAGCEAWDYTYLQEPANCHAQLNGIIFKDENADCNKNGSEPYIFGHYIKLDNGSGYSSYYYCNNYYFMVPTGTYTLEINKKKYFDPECPVNGKYTINVSNGNVYTNNFSMVAPADTNDLRINMYSGSARPGFDHYYGISFSNEGSTKQVPEIKVIHDAEEDFTGSANLPVSNYNAATREITFRLDTLFPGGWGYLYLYTKIHSNTPLGSKVCADASISSALVDHFPADNTSQDCREVTGSYDPNLIEVNPKGAGSLGFITEKDSILNYTVHFQNTGSDSAFTVVVKDTLSTNLDANTFQFTYASHPVVVTRDAKNVIFTFGNIMLPDSTRNEKASHGVVSYSVKQKKGLKSGDQIKARAGIYFDYNVPVATNEVLNTLDIISSVKPLISPQLRVEPNPATDKIRIHADLKGDHTWKMMDITGRIVKSGLMHDKEALIERGELNAGIYFIEVGTGTSALKSKVVFE